LIDCERGCEAYEGQKEKTVSCIRIFHILKRSQKASHKINFRGVIMLIFVTHEHREMKREDSREMDKSK
jgi:hypothetical protein